LRFDMTAHPMPVQITSSDGEERAYWRPSWSPDGTHIAYQFATPEEVALYVMDTDGTNVRRIAPGAGAPEWAPIGTEVAVSDLRPGHRGIAVIDLSDPKLRFQEVTHVPDGVPEEYPTWSPDGRWLAFNSQRIGHELWTVRRDGRELAPLTDDPSLDDSPAWSPDGSRIAFLSTRTGEGDIYLVDPDGANLLQLTDGPYFEGGPAWSPDGNYLIFTARTVSTSEEGNLGLWVMRSDGTDATLLFDSPSEHLMPDWAR
jgi:TolB protein